MLPRRLPTWRRCRAIAWKRLEATELGSTPFASISNGGSVSNGLPMQSVRRTSKLSIITEQGGSMTRPAIHPGEILADELEELGITPTELSRQIAVPPNRISQ